MKDIKLKSNIKKICIFLICIIGLIGIVYAATSKLYKVKENKFTPADVNISVEENGDNNVTPVITKAMEFVEKDGNYEVDKEVKIVNVDKDGVNNTRAWSRVCIMPQLMKTNTTKDASGKEIKVEVVLGSSSFDALNADEIATQLSTGNSYTIDEITFILNENWKENWEYGEDGYFYYKNALEPGEKTTTLLENVVMNKEYADTLDDGIWLRVSVLADMIQADGDDAISPLDRWK